MLRALPVVIVLALAGACNTDDGRELRPAPPGATTTTTSSAGPATTGLGEIEPGTAGTLATAAIDSPATPVDSAVGLGVTVPFRGGAIDRRYSCDGEGLAPQIGWFNVPDGTREVAFVVVDPDAAGFVHWVVTGLDPAAGSYLPDAGAAVVEAVNSAGDIGWAPPCPPAGDPPHRYTFTLYAVGQPLDIAPESPASDVIEAIEGGAIARAVETATYAR